MTARASEVSGRAQNTPVSPPPANVGETIGWNDTCTGAGARGHGRLASWLSGHGGGD